MSYSDSIPNKGSLDDMSHHIAYIKSLIAALMQSGGFHAGENIFNSNFTLFH